MYNGMRRHLPRRPKVSVPGRMIAMGDRYESPNLLLERFRETGPRPRAPAPETRPVGRGNHHAMSARAKSRAARERQRACALGRPTAPERSEGSGGGRVRPDEARALARRAGRAPERSDVALRPA